MYFINPTYLSKKQIRSNKMNVIFKMCVKIISIIMISIKIAILGNEVRGRSISPLKYTQNSCNIIHLVQYSYYILIS